MRALLAISLAGLFALLIWQWHDWPPSQKTGSQTTPGQVMPQTDAPVTGSPMDLPPVVPKEDYHSVTERPLFLSSRRPPASASEGEPEPVANATPAPLTPLDAMDLNAVIITPQGALAWVRTPSEPKLQKIQIGDELEGWKVKAILPDEVEMEGNSGADRLLLRRFEQAAQQGAAKSPPPAGGGQGSRPAAPKRPPTQQASAKDKTKPVPAKPNRPISPPNPRASARDNIKAVPAKPYQPPVPPPH